MKAKTIIYLAGGDRIKTPFTMPTIIGNLDRLGPPGTLSVERLTDHGSLKHCYIPTPMIVRLEEL